MSGAVGEMPAVGTMARPRVVRLAQVVMRGGVDLVGMAARGEIDRRMFWVAANGAAEMVAAIAGGDVCSARVSMGRAAACMGCSGRVEVEGLVVGTCGEVFRPSVEVGRETCGCVLDGAVMVGSKRCVRGRWSE